MRFQRNFINHHTDERRTIVASLSLAEIECIDRLRRHEGSETADLMAEAFALRKSYAEVSDGFRHTEPPKIMLLA